MPYKIYLRDRDVEALKFLWKWKVATTMALAQKVFPNVQVQSAYRRICYLREAGLVRTVRTDDRKGDIWTLNQSGFMAIREDLPTLVQEGFRSEYVRHDMLTAAFQLTPFFCYQPNGVTIISEQELRRFDFREYHSAIPKTTTHRPDGYWVFSKSDGTHQVIAIEVELHKKGISKYEGTSDFYRHSAEINEVFWITKGNSDADSIQSAMRQDTSPKGARHSFMKLKEFETKGVQASFCLGFRKGLTLKNILPTTSATCQHLGDQKLLLEKKICPFKSKDYRSQYFVQKTQQTRDSSPYQNSGETSS